MSIRRVVEIVLVFVSSLTALFAMHAWIASRDEQQRLQDTLAAQKRVINAAAALEHTRDANLKVALAEIDRLKHDEQSPIQIIRDLPKYLPLPSPIRMTGKIDISQTASHREASPPEGNSISLSKATSSSEHLPAAPAAQIPTADLKSLFDFAQDYRACQLRLTAANQDAADQTAQVTALSRERNAAITAAKGGGFWHRLRGNAIWFAIGAGTGYSLAKR